MHIDSLITDLALITIVAAVVTLIFKKIKQPVVLGYVLAGFLISPNFELLPTILNQGSITAWADLGVVFLMFGLGLEFSFKKIASVGGSAFTIAVTVMVCMILVGSGVGYLLGWGKMDCIFLGGMISMSSTMIIMKAYEEYNLKKEKFAQLVLGALVIEDIAGIFMLIILSTVSISNNVSGVELGMQIVMLLAYLIIWLLLGIFLIPSLLKSVSKLLNDEMVVIVSIAICLGMVKIAGAIGFSSSLGAFMAGSILAGTVQSVRVEMLVKPIKDFFGAVFFVSVGMLIRPDMLISHIAPILIICVVVILGQMLFSTLGILLSGQSLETAIRGGFSMVQIGEFSFIVATLGMSLGVISEFLYPIIVCVSVITSFVTPAMMKVSIPVYSFVNAHLPKGIKIMLKAYTSDNKSKFDIDDDWNGLIKSIVIRTLLCSSIMFVIYWVGIKWLEPVLIVRMGSNIKGEVVATVLVALLMIPFANYMLNANDTLWYKLWVKNRYNRLPLLTLRAIRIIIAACFVALAVRHLFRIPFAILVLIALIPIIMVVRSEFLKGVTITMEKKFIANFSEKTLERQKSEQTSLGRTSANLWLNESLYVIEFEITDKDFNKTVNEITRDRAFMVAIIRIIRGGIYINTPSKDEVLQYGDILQMVGNWDQVDACTILLEKEHYIKYTDTPDKVLKDFIYEQTFRGVPEEDQLICVPVKVNAGSEVILKSIRNSNIRRRFKATIIGIERGNLPIVAPSIETIIYKDDMLWLIGGNEMVKKLVVGGFMNE